MPDQPPKSPATPPPVLLEATKVVVRYGAIEALHGVTMNVRQGQIVCLIGANGAGKTTFLRAISGLIPTARGSIVYHPTHAREEHAAGPARAAALQSTPAHRIVALGISHVPEGRGIFGSMTVRENLDLGAYLRRDAAAINEDRQRVLGLFPRIAERLNQSAGTLSGGEQQMLAIGRALMARPRLLLLDEPSLGLAPLLVEQIFSIIQTIHRQGATVLLVEQNAHLALNISDYAYVLETGQVALHGPAAEIAGNPQVKKAYLGG